jgi:hypothetical protein
LKGSVSSQGTQEQQIYNLKYHSENNNLPYREMIRPPKKLGGWIISWTVDPKTDKNMSKAIGARLEKSLFQHISPNN